VHGENSEEQLGTFSTSTLHSVPSSLGLPSVRLHKASDARPALWNLWGSPGSHSLFYVRLTVHLELYLYNKAWRYTIFFHFITSTYFRPICSPSSGGRV
jgi:hypothetical protein